jgi:hypothetical protein
MNAKRASALLGFLLAILVSNPALADNSVSFKLLKGPAYESEGYTLGAKQLEGYLGTLKEEDGITEAVLTGSDGGDDEGETLFANAAKRAGVKAMRKEHGEIREL